MLATDDTVLICTILCIALLSEQPRTSLITCSQPQYNYAEVVTLNRQIGGMDCGVCVIAISAALAFDQDPELIKFDQPANHPHLVECFEKGQLSIPIIIIIMYMQ